MCYEVFFFVLDGCAINRNICKYKEEIKQAEEYMNNLNNRFEELYNQNRWEYLYLQEAMNDNEYIQRSINEAMRDVEKESEIANMINLRLSLTLSKMEQMYTNSSNATEAVNNIIKPLSFGFNDVSKMLHSEAKKGLIVFAAFKVGQVVFEYIMDYINKAVNKFFSATNQYDVMDVMFSDKSKGDPSKNKVKKFLNDKIFSKKFFARIKNSFRYMYDKVISIKDKVSVKKIVAASKNAWKKKGKIWKGIKNGFKSIFIAVKKYVVKIKNFVKHPIQSFKKYKASNFKFQPGKALSNFISAGFAALETWMIKKQWDSVADNLKQTADEYKTYNEKLAGAVAEVEEEAITIGGYWDNVTKSFQETIGGFKEVIDDVNSKNGSYFDMYGMNSTDIDTSHAFYHTDFETTNRTLIFKHQKLVREYLENSDNTLQSLTNKFRARETIFNVTDIYISENKDIKTIYTLLKQIYKSKNNEIEKTFGRELTVKKVVCTAAMLYPDEEEYDFYNLQIFLKTMCDISDAEFEKMDAEATKRRMGKILTQIVQRDVAKSKTVGDIFDAVKGSYELQDDEETKQFGAALRKQDIVCEIAQSFPSRAQYQTYPLDRFRPSCSAVTDQEFQTMSEKAKKYGQIKSMLDMMMPICATQPNVCQCPNYFALVLRVDEATIKDMINEYKPKPNCVYKDTSPCKWECPS